MTIPGSPDRRDPALRAASGEPQGAAAPFSSGASQTRPGEERIVLDGAAIQRVTTRMAHEIRERNSDLDQVEVVAIVQGGVPVARMLAARLHEICGREIGVGELDVTLYRDDVVGRGKRPVPKRTRMPHSMTGKRVVLVDDVVFTGRTIRAAMDAVIDFGRPQGIQVACLVDRGHREFPIHVDFVGKNIPTSRDEEVSLRVRPDGDYEVGVR